MKMGAAIFHTGGHGSATLTKLATNALMGVQVAAHDEIIGVLTREGADVARVLSAVAGTSSWSTLAGGMSTMMLGNNFAPQFPAELIEKDFNYILNLPLNQIRLLHSTERVTCFVWRWKTGSAETICLAWCDFSADWHDHYLS